MGTEGESKSRRSRSKGPAPKSAWEKIPLPPLPGAIRLKPRSTARRASTQKASNPGLSNEESDALLGAPAAETASRSQVSKPAAERPRSAKKPRPAAQGHNESQPRAAARTGAPGAEMLNDLVDQIERDLTRQPSPTGLPDYSTTAGCWFEDLDLPDETIDQTPFDGAWRR